jgi:hypothetical protein
MHPDLRFQSDFISTNVIAHSKIRSQLQPRPNLSNRPSSIAKQFTRRQRIGQSRTPALNSLHPSVDRSYLHNKVAGTLEAGICVRDLSSWPIPWKLEPCAPKIEEHQKMETGFRASFQIPSSAEDCTGLVGWWRRG